MYESLGKTFERFTIIAIVLLIIFVPLGLWKLIDILIWFFSGLSWGS